jgi:hypothetical protein
MRGNRGFASLISIVIVLLIVLVLMQRYMKSSLPTGKEAADQRTAIDAAKQRASQVEAIQQRQMQQADEALSQ